LDQLWQLHRTRLVNVDGVAAGTLEPYDRVMGQILALFPSLQLIQVDTDRVEVILETLGRRTG